jgi:hypothetical protein
MPSLLRDTPKTQTMEEGFLESEEIHSEDLENPEEGLLEGDDAEGCIDINDLNDMEEEWITHEKSKNEYCKVKGSYTYDAATRTYTLTPGTKTRYYKIRLTQGKIAIVSKRQFKRIRKHRWCAVKMKKKEGELWYTVAIIKGQQVKMHQFLTDYRYEQVDHINGDGLMNIDENLRDGGSSINQRNNTDATGACYLAHSKCYFAQYVEYDGKPTAKNFYVRDYATKEDTRIAAEAWYQTNAERIRQQIIRDGECPEEEKHQPTPKSSNSGEHHIIDYPDQNGFLVKIYRAGKPHSARFSYRGRNKQEVLQEAIAWRDAVIAANPPKPKGRPKKQKTE